MHSIKLLKGNTTLSNSMIEFVEKKLNSVITNELKNYYKMRIYILDKEEEKFLEDKDIDPDYLGCFFCDPSARGEKYPYIEIYSNRIKNSLHIKTYASTLFKIIMTKVIIHELSHAYMFPFERDAKYNTIHKKDREDYDCYLKLLNCFYQDNEPFKTIEESLANYITYNQNWEYYDREIVRDFIFRQPNDYKNALSFIHVKNSPYELSNQWRTVKRISNNNLPLSKYKDTLKSIAECIIENKFPHNFSFKNKHFEDIDLFHKLGGDCGKYLALKRLKDKL